MARPHRPDVRSRFAAAVAVALAGFAALSVLQRVVPQRDGPPALAQIFAPHVFLVLLVPGFASFVRGGPRVRLVTAGALLVSGVIHAPVLFRPAGGTHPRPDDVAVLSWNLEYRGQDPGRVVERIGASGASVVALQELEPRAAAALAVDPVLRTRLPHAALHPHQGYLGTGILSAYPILEQGSRRDPPLTWVRLDVAGRTVTVVNGHPLPARIRWLLAAPVGYHSGHRDASIRAVRDLVDAALARGDRVLLVGDFNVTEREPAYRELASGLTDAHLAVGGGPGFTWKGPGPLRALPFALLRIDYLFAGPGVVPRTVAVDCGSAFSDHCVVEGWFGLDP
jgi:vancomycin resistance protein VanJ